MTRGFTPGVVTANDLFDGEVVYLAAGGAWTRHLAQALFLADESAARAHLDLAKAQTVVVDPYLAEAAAGPDGRPAPVRRREALRARGPTNRPHGKQATV